MRFFLHITITLCVAGAIWTHTKAGCTLRKCHMCEAVRQGTAARLHSGAIDACSQGQAGRAGHKVSMSPAAHESPAFAHEWP